MLCSTRVLHHVILGLYRCRYSVGRVSIIGPRAHIYRFHIEHEPKTCVLDHYFIPTPGLHPRVPPPCLHVTRSLPYMGSTPNNPRPPDMGVHCYTTIGCTGFSEGGLGVKKCGLYTGIYSISFRSLNMAARRIKLHIWGISYASGQFLLTLIIDI